MTCHVDSPNDLLNAEIEIWLDISDVVEINLKRTHLFQCGSI